MFNDLIFQYNIYKVSSDLKNKILYRHKKLLEHGIKKYQLLESFVVL